MNCFYGMIGALPRIRDAAAEDGGRAGFRIGFGKGTPDGLKISAGAGHRIDKTLAAGVLLIVELNRIYLAMAIDFTRSRYNRGEQA